MNEFDLRGRLQSASARRTAATQVRDYQMVDRRTAEEARREMGKEFVAIRQRIGRERMQNRWFYVTSLIAAVGIEGWIAGGALWVLVALILVLGVNIALPLDTYFKLRGALARDRAKKGS